MPSRDSDRKAAKLPRRTCFIPLIAFDEVRQKGKETAIIVPRVSSENREYLPCGFFRQEQ